MFLPLLLLGCGSNTEPVVENTPTSGNLTVYYDEGLTEHVVNQAYTFEALYPKVNLSLVATSEDAAVAALYNDSCESIVIARDLTQKEKSAFASKKYSTYHSIVARTGVAVLVNSSSPLRCATKQQLIAFLKEAKALSDSVGKPLLPEIIFDAPNSGVLHYMIDTVVKSKTLAVPAKVAKNSRDALQYVAEHQTAMAFIDFACISDKDSKMWKDYASKIKLLPLANAGDSIYEPPHQSSFKLGTYPLTRGIYVHRKQGDHSLAKGFESFVMGPKGQIIFLKQGLLPEKQQERSVHINIEQ